MKLHNALMILRLIVLACLVGAPAQAIERTPRDIQQALSSKGFSPGSIDGLWGKKSANALREFQKANGLAPTGKPDDATIAALFLESPQLQDEPNMLRDEIENKPIDHHVNPAPSAETASDEKTGEVPSKIDAVPEKSIAGISTTTEITPNAMTKTPEVGVGAKVSSSIPEETLGEPFTLHIVALIVFAMLILFIRKRKSNTLTVLSPRSVDPAPATIPPDVSRVLAQPTEPRVDDLTATEMQRPAVQSIPESLAAHNSAVMDWVKQNAGRNTSRPYAPPNDALTEIEERSPAGDDKQVTSLSTHAAAVKQWITDNAEASKQRHDEAQKRYFDIHSERQASTPSSTGWKEPTAEVNPAISLAGHNGAVKQWVTENAEASRRRHDEAQRQQPNTPTRTLAVTSSSTGWREKDSPTTIAGITISQGLIYVGKSLGKDGGRHEAENCLINPGLHVAQWGDREGRTMGYWPSYSSISPEARRSYLEWLAGERSDPNTYIGYVFLYFYGLERRLMLERNAPDAPVVTAEVRRLLEIYGGNSSFNRYSMELLTAVELRSGEPSAHFLARIEPNGYEVPTAIRIALGICVRDDRIMEPDLLYRFAMTHPETRARTPAKRAPELMRQLFAQQLLNEHPSGFRYKAARAKPLQKHYKACSGSFEVDIEILGGKIPDIAHHSQPIGMARRIFEACSDALDDYSRALGRLPGLTPNFIAVSKLPKALRAQQAGLLEGSPLDQFAEMSRGATLTTVSNVAHLAGIDVGIPPTKSKLREVSQLLAAFGFGVTFDPAFATKALSGSDPALIFAIAAETTAEPTDRYRSIQLAVMLGLIIGHADGHFDDSERDTLIQRIERESSLNANERSRLRAELRLNEVYPDRLEDWTKRLKDVSAEAKMTVADELISVASADGNLHAAEIRKLELIFKRMGLANQALYDRLHSGTSSPVSTAGSSANGTSTGIPTAKPATRIDQSKLHSIRSETSVTANVLADIFADDDAGASEPILVEVNTDAPESGTFEGLEQRYGALLNELRLQASWAAADFDHLARDAGLMPGAAREAINDWSMDRFNELIIEGDDPVEICLHLLPSLEMAISADGMEGKPA
ncbi:MAG: TerB N-terminal domain-containing protein [Rhizobiaceae bacterium]|nr:TerB N-terminal domain-containing protein [Rhizobiaceae bacterium]